jgi:hypothetical protein
MSERKTRRTAVAIAPTNDPPDASTFERSFVIRPRLPIFDGIFHLGPDVLIAAHGPHKHISEHLHDHLPHLHIRYGFEVPRQNFDWIPRAGVAPQVMMMIKVDQRVDCNPVFVAKGDGAEGLCLKIGGQDVHWVHDTEASEKATRLFSATGRQMPNGFRFIGFSTSDLEERRKHRYSRLDLLAAVGAGLRVDQHFQATWIEPSEKRIEPYPVTICLADDVTDYHVFFSLPVTVNIGAF